MDYVKRVRAARGATNLSLEKFADAIGVGRSTLVRIEQGAREPNLEEYVAMSAVSGLPLAFFTTADLAAALGEDAPAPGELEALRRSVEDRFSQIADALANLSATDLQLQRELEELRGADRPRGRREGPGRG